MGPRGRHRVTPLLLLIFFLVIGAHAYTSYANDWADPDYIVAGVFPRNTLAAQRSILRWAIYSARRGPWIWKECNYVRRDGQFNPDTRLVNDAGNFQALADSVLYNALAFAITTNGTKGTSSSYSLNVVNFIKIWFLNAETKMNPNLNYGQMQRGPTGQSGSRKGILDMKCMTKIVNAIEILRKTNCKDWTSDLDNQMKSWTTQYIRWLETANISLAEKVAPNNHGTFWYNQVAALKILIGDKAGALNVTNTYFASQYLSQITSDGEQPLEAARTRPYHYRAYNIAAMITNARLSAYVGNPSVWNQTTSTGSTIQTALDFTMNVNPSASNETIDTTNLYPSIAAVGAMYGDPQRRYSGFMKRQVPHYGEEACFLWNQPMEGGEEDSEHIAKTRTATSKHQPTALSGNASLKNNSERSSSKEHLYATSNSGATIPFERRCKGTVLSNSKSKT
ncbi:hypothetical protein H0H93_008074 [Arthromyces matolae]|nr:hypothetical protein H0H93_008074 [Arthromyces matolae]